MSEWQTLGAEARHLQQALEEAKEATGFSQQNDGTTDVTDRAVDELQGH